MTIICKLLLGQNFIFVGNELRVFQHGACGENVEHSELQHTETIFMQLIITQIVLVTDTLLTEEMI
jgi:hypothetical protein